MVITQEMKVKLPVETGVAALMEKIGAPDDVRELAALRIMREIDDIRARSSQKQKDTSKASSAEDVRNEASWVKPDLKMLGLSDMQQQTAVQGIGDIAIKAISAGRSK